MHIQVKAYILFGLSIMCPLVWGMETKNERTKKPRTRAIIVKPAQYYTHVPIKDNKRAHCQKVFDAYGIPFDDTIEKIIHISPVEEINPRIKLIAFLPLDAFTKGTKYTITTTNVVTEKKLTLKLIGNTIREENSFISFTDYFNSQNYHSKITIT